MPYIFSTKQIDHCHHLLTEHNMDFNQIADVMGTSVRNAHHLIRLVWQKYPKPKQIFKPKPEHKLDKKSCHTIVKEIHGAFIRPKAEYSNKRIYDLI